MAVATSIDAFTRRVETVAVAPGARFVVSCLSPVRCSSATRDTGGFPTVCEAFQLNSAGRTTVKGSPSNTHRVVAAVQRRSEQVGKTVGGLAISIGEAGRIRRSRFQHESQRWVVNSGISHGRNSCLFAGRRATAPVLHSWNSQARESSPILRHQRQQYRSAATTVSPEVRQVAAASSRPRTTTWWCPTKIVSERATFLGKLFEGHQVGGLSSGHLCRRMDAVVPRRPLGVIGVASRRSKTAMQPARGFSPALGRNSVDWRRRVDERRCRSQVQRAVPVPTDEVPGAARCRTVVVNTGSWQRQTCRGSRPRQVRSLRCSGVLAGAQCRRAKVSPRRSDSARRKARILVSALHPAQRSRANGHVGDPFVRPESGAACIVRCR